MTATYLDFPFSGSIRRGPQAGRSHTHKNLAWRGWGQNPGLPPLGGTPVEFFEDHQAGGFLFSSLPETTFQSFYGITLIYYYLLQ